MTIRIVIPLQLLVDDHRGPFVRAHRNRLWTLAFAAAAAVVGDVRSAAPGETARALQDLHVSATSAPSMPGNPLWDVSLEALSSTRDRPLFSPERRPPVPRLPEIAPPPPATALPAREPDHPGVVLVGTIVGTAREMAVLLEEKAKAVIRMRLGEAHDGWVLRTIARREVTLEKEGRIETLALSATGADALRSGPIQFAEHQPAAITRFAGAVPAVDPSRRCASGAAASSSNSAACALGLGRARLIRK
jgi:hypothetical protein